MWLKRMPLIVRSLSVVLTTTVGFVGYASANGTKTINSYGTIVCDDTRWQVIKGISIYADEAHAFWAHGILCQDSGYNYESNDYVFPYRNRDGHPVDAIVKPSWGSIGGGDWDEGYVKAECANNEYVQYITRDDVGPGIVDSAGCRYFGDGSYLANSCHRLDFGVADNPRTPPSGEWDYGYVKNECDDGEIVKGFSIYPSGVLKSILCCRFLAPIP
jgi:hypothetical protein